MTSLAKLLISESDYSHAVLSGKEWKKKHSSANWPIGYLSGKIRIVRREKKNCKRKKNDVNQETCQNLSKFTDFEKSPFESISSDGSGISTRNWIFRAQGAQSFTSLTADLRQDINRVSSFIMCLNGTFPEGIAPLRYKTSKWEE